MAVMTAQEFINKALEILSYNTTYVWGGKGILLDTNPEKNKYLWTYADNNNIHYNQKENIWSKIVERC